MANRQTKTVVTADDDLTGVTGSDAEAVKITINGKSATLDLLPASLNALMALVTGESPAERTRSLRGILTSGPAASSARRRSGSRSGTSAGSGDGAVKRAWLAANGFQMSESGRGKFSAEMNAAWDAHNSARASAASLASDKPGNLGALAAPALTPASTGKPA